ncbi:lactate racemase domain-containing protein [Aeoliella mucimassa]|uniref:LarA-like N-terminal domain-containing protein n=1 Tax=Aeoliella mucimassa TaxID=2527972 RepID=A0A518AV87_9BACT|nr:lactate racemase domain-containing protein [Aeoliella mucimassa]QDU58623.1 hypothetical protein Pan181_48620 [Aeoliella mucimassa]
MPVVTHIHLGDCPPLELSLRDEAWIGCHEPQSPGEAESLDVAAATMAALQQPVGFPPITQAMVPGDQVAIALGADVRQADAVVRGLVAALEWAGAGRESVQVVVGSTAEADTLREQLQDLVQDGCVVIGHTPSDEKALCYLAAVDEVPLLMCRELFEADVVIPVGCGRTAGSYDSRGPYESLYPRFSDTATQRRYEQADALDGPTAVSTRRGETDRAGWLLGASLVVQVVPAPGGGVAKVVAGAPDDVAQAVAEACDSQWVQEVESRARLVVATLAGNEQEQTWDNVARALYAASLAADEDYSAVAICTRIHTPPGKTLRKLMTMNGDLERVASELQGAQTDDAQAAWEIYKALCRGPVYFMSQLDEETVEELGMTHVNSPEELTRLVERSESCLVLNEGQYAVPRFPAHSR